MLLIVILCVIGIISGPVVVIVENVRTMRLLRFLADLDKLNSKEK